MNRSLSAPGFEVPEPAFAGLSEAAVPEIAARLTLAHLAEMARRFSGVIAIAVLGLAMVVLALRAEGQAGNGTGVASSVAPAAEASDAAVAGGGPASGAPAPSASLATYVQPERTVVYYLYDNETQRQMVMLAESIAGQEIATETVTPAYREFYALDASTPEGEQSARDTIFEATIAGGAETRVIVHDLRDVP